MTMSGAYATLRFKRNLLVSDRLAILSNLAHYPFRINTKKVINENLSYTACIIALALQNGDLSCLCLFGGIREGHTNRTATHEGSDMSGSWLPSLQFSLNEVIPESSLDFTSSHYSGHPSYVVGNKGLFRGLVWEIEAYDTGGFSDFRDAYPEILELACKISGGESYFWQSVLLQILLRHLVSVGSWDLVELVVLCALPRQLENPEEMCILLSRLESWARDGGDESWPSELLSAKRIPTRPGHSEAFKGKDDTMNDSGPPLRHGRPLLHWICVCVGSNMPLPIGKCMVRSDNGNSKTLIGLFTVDPTKHKKVFTPLDGLEYEFGNSIWPGVVPKRAFFSCVEEMDGIGPSDEDIQKAGGFLGGTEDILPDKKVYRVLHVTDRKAVWSHRLSRNGILEKNGQDGWTTVPFGQGESALLSMSRRSARSS